MSKTSVSHNKIKKIRKRDGRIVDFEEGKIIDAITKAIAAINGENRPLARRLADKVVKIMNERVKKDEVPQVEQLQDVVEETLMGARQYKAAKAYILYREQHRKMREAVDIGVSSLKMVDEYLEEIDWRVHENSNMSYSLQGLNNHIATLITTKYWIDKIYPPEVRKAQEAGDFHIHNLGLLAVYCCGWDLKDLLTRGFGGVFGKIESKPPKHLRTALGQIVNFFYTLQGEAAGAQAFSNFDTLLAPYVRYDGLTYRDVKQSMQEFLFNTNVPTRVGFQTPFTNITMDLVPPDTLGEEAVMFGGVQQKEQYKDFQEEMNMINRAFAEVMVEGDAHGRVFTFPIPTYNITKDFDWENPAWDPIWEMTAKYGIPYFSNFINSDMDPEDARSMCCRLRLDYKELYKRGGALFGANPLTGSIGVVTLNLPRIGYLAHDENEFFNRLAKLMDIAKTSLEIKRKNLERFTEKGLYPYSKHYLSNIKLQRGQFWGNHFSTIGIIGMNECLLNFRPVRNGIVSPKGRKFALKVLDFMRDRIVKYQDETGSLYNLEATPAEGTSYSLAKEDKAKFPDIITASDRYYAKDNAANKKTGEVAGKIKDKEKVKV